MTTSRLQELGPAAPDTPFCCHIYSPGLFPCNFVVCLVAYQKTAMRSAMNVLLASLAFADLLLAVLDMPFALRTIIVTRWVFGDIFCRASAMFFWLFVIEGVVILLIIGIDRFLIIVQRQDKLTPYRAKILIVISWVSAFIVAFPVCGKPEPAVMLYSFMGILNTVRHSAVRIHSHPDSTCLSQASKLGLMSLGLLVFQMNIDMSFKTCAFTTIVILFIVFIICWAPFTTHSLIATFTSTFITSTTFLR